MSGQLIPSARLAPDREANLSPRHAVSHRPPQPVLTLMMHGETPPSGRTSARKDATPLARRILPRLLLPLPLANATWLAAAGPLDVAPFNEQNWVPSGGAVAGVNEEKLEAVKNATTAVGASSTKAAAVVADAAAARRKEQHTIPIWTRAKSAQDRPS